MTLPAAGWFPDPQDRTRLRWWDGRTWAGSTRPAPRVTGTEPVMRSVEEAPVAPSFSVAGPGMTLRAQPWAYGSGIRRASAGRRFGLWAWGAVVVAGASVFVNPYGLLSVLGIALGIVGVAAPWATGAWRVVARSVAISALVLAVATGAIAANTEFGVVDALAHLL